MFHILSTHFKVVLWLPSAVPVRELTVLAATLFDQTRCCIAGIDSEGRWVRPGFPGAMLGTYPEARLVLPSHLWDQSGFMGTGLAVLSMDLISPKRLTRPHVEDMELAGLPRMVRTLSKEKERIHFLDDHSENDVLPEVDDIESLGEGLAGLGRSLILVGPVRPSVVTFGNQAGQGGRVRYRVKIRFKLPRQRTEVQLSSTDLTWRAVGRALGADNELVELSGTEVCNRLAVRPDLYITIGLTRGDPFPLAAGVHTVPAIDSVQTSSGQVRVKVQQNKL